MKTNSAVIAVALLELLGVEYCKINGKSLNEYDGNEPGDTEDCEKLVKLAESVCDMQEFLVFLLYTCWANLEGGFDDWDFIQYGRINPPETPLPHTVNQQYFSSIGLPPVFSNSRTRIVCPGLAVVQPALSSINNSATFTIGIGMENLLLRYVRLGIIRAPFATEVSSFQLEQSKSTHLQYEWSEGTVSVGPGKLVNFPGHSGSDGYKSCLILDPKRKKSLNYKNWEDFDADEPDFEVSIEVKNGKIMFYGPEKEPISEPAAVDIKANEKWYFFVEVTAMGTCTINQPETGECIYYPVGECTQNACKFLHVPQNKKHKIG